MFLILATSCGANDDPLWMTPHNLSTASFELVQLLPESHKVGGTLPRRWVAKQTFGWLKQSERSSKAYEHLFLDELDYDHGDDESLDAASFCLYVALVIQLLVFFATAEPLPRFDSLCGGTEHGVFGVVPIVGPVHDGVSAGARDLAGAIRVRPDELELFQIVGSAGGTSTAALV
jgi:hypothetical protein